MSAVASAAVPSTADAHAQPPHSSTLPAHANGLPAPHHGVEALGDGVRMGDVPRNDGARAMPVASESAAPHPYLPLAPAATLTSHAPYGGVEFGGGMPPPHAAASARAAEQHAMGMAVQEAVARGNDGLDTPDAIAPGYVAANAPSMPQNVTGITGIPPTPLDPSEWLLQIHPASRILFEKQLTHSDTNRLGRMVLPKSYAEQHFSALDGQHGVPVVVADVYGRTWTFKYRWWPNNNSKMYLLEGIQPFIRTAGFEAGDIFVFAVCPRGNFQVGGKKRLTAAPALQSRPKSSASLKGKAAHGAAAGGAAAASAIAQVTGRPNPACVAAIPGAMPQYVAPVRVLSTPPGLALPPAELLPAAQSFAQQSLQPHPMPETSVAASRSGMRMPDQLALLPIDQLPLPLPAGVNGQLGGERGMTAAAAQFAAAQVLLQRPRQQSGCVPLPTLAAASAELAPTAALAQELVEAAGLAADGHSDAPALPPRGKRSREKQALWPTVPSNTIKMLFETELTSSDVHRTSRLVLPAEHAEMFFPQITSEVQAMLLTCFEPDGQPWQFKYFWCARPPHVCARPPRRAPQSSPDIACARALAMRHPHSSADPRQGTMYVLEGVPPYIQQADLVPGDALVFGQSSDGNFIIGSRKQSAANIMHSSVSLGAEPAASALSARAKGKARRQTPAAAGEQAACDTSS